MRSVCSVILAVLLVASQRAGAEPDATVAPNGSAKYKSIQDAINAAPQLTSADKAWTILVRAGTYNELVYVQREKRFIRLIGEDAAKTIITYDLNANMKGVDGRIISTFRTPTVVIDADDFTCEGLTFENSAGRVGQALAIRIDGDRDVFRDCRFLGYQDTIFSNRGRHYFENCYIAGAVDFIFGGATDWFEKCEIHCVANGYITAPSTQENQAFGFIFSNCKIAGANDEVRTFLARPWRAYGSTTFLSCEMSAVIKPEGWNNWGKPEREKTARFAEFQSTGPGADASKRVPWAKQLTEEQAKAITVEKVLSGADGWKPESQR